MAMSFEEMVKAQQEANDKKAMYNTFAGAADSLSSIPTVGDIMLKRDVKGNAGAGLRAIAEGIQDPMKQYNDRAVFEENTAKANNARTMSDPKSPQSVRAVETMKQMFPNLSSKFEGMSASELEKFTDKNDLAKTWASGQNDLAKHKATLAAEQASKGKEGSLKLASEYGKEPAIARTQVVNEAAKKMMTAVSDPSPAGDMSMIYGFMKIQDPNSSVREGEYATAANAGGMSEKVRNTYNSILKGEKLTDSQRADFYNQAKKIAQSSQESSRPVLEHYQDLSKFAGYEPHYQDINMPMPDYGEIPAVKARQQKLADAKKNAPPGFFERLMGGGNSANAAAPTTFDSKVSEYAKKYMQANPGLTEEGARKAAIKKLSGG